MDLGQVTIKDLGNIEQQLTQLLKTMRNAKLHEHPLYQTLQAFEQEISDERRDRYDDNNSRYDGY